MSLTPEANRKNWMAELAEFHQQWLRGEHTVDPDAFKNWPVVGHFTMLGKRETDIETDIETDKTRVDIAEPLTGQGRPDLQDRTG